MILDILLTGRTIAYNVKFAKISGSVNAALLLSQLCFWSDKSKIKNFFYKTIDELEDETGLSRHEQDNAIKLLVKRNLITVIKKGVPPKRYFTVDFKTIEKALILLENTPLNTENSQFAENRQIDLPETSKLNCRKLANQIAGKPQIHYISTRAFNTQDDNIDDIERRENFFTSENITSFIDHLLSTENVKSPVSYKSKIKNSLLNGDKTTLNNFYDYLDDRLKKSNKIDFSIDSDRYSGKEIIYQDHFYEIDRFGDYDSFINLDPIYKDSIILRCFDENRNFKFFMFISSDEMFSFIDSNLIYQRGLA